MKLTTQQSYELLAKHGSYITEIWCSRECRGDGQRETALKPGRPRQYRNGDERRAAKTRQQRDYRLRPSVEKTVCIQTKTKDLQAQKAPLSHHTPTRAFQGANP